MNTKSWTYCLILLLSSFTSSSQISPGDLTSAHAHLEGMSNCTQCHDLGNKVPDQKCLDCHSEIDDLIKADRGYHVSDEVKNKTCVDCHNEHHGRKFEMIRFDEEAFDHNLAGYELEGEHAVIDCRKCHQPDNIVDKELKKRSETFLGMGRECLSCHDDFHQQTLSNDCVQCHNFDHFRPATGFDHDNADFMLEGGHLSVDCKECHPTIIKNGVDFQQFTGIGFGDCVDCHQDVHEGQLVGSCTQCHSETSFSKFIGNRRFDHSRTEFELKGSHAKVNCFDCHKPDSNPVTVFQDRLGMQEQNCVACHDDVHEGKFGTDCARCHTEESFYAVKAMDDFDHSVTDYPLEGMHIGVDCKACHKGRFTEEIAFAECKNCHSDYHQGEFATAVSSPDCKECHVITERFDYTTFGLAEHEQAAFALDGAHVATPCFACHVSEEHWRFRNIGETCIDCHQDIHQDHISEMYYPKKDCTSCHSTDRWTSVEFDHDLTEFALVGKHSSVECRACHLDDSKNSFTLHQDFKGVHPECSSCHENIHGDQFLVEGITDCKRCHDTESWFPNSFDHNDTAFPLEGKHAEIDCRACHFSEIGENGEDQVVYKIQKTECIDCHS